MPKEDQAPENAPTDSNSIGPTAVEKNGSDLNDQPTHVGSGGERNESLR
jgi:hypothetical protein